MGNPFARTKSTLAEPSNRDYGLFSFAFNEAHPIPIQVLEIPTDIFDRFPAVKRHWPKRGDKSLRPLICTDGAAHTGGKCLSCYAMNQNLLQFGQYDPSNDVAVPIFDLGDYRKQEKKYILVPPGQPLHQEDKSIRKGGLKVLFSNSTTFNKLINENDNIQNHCANCNSHMLIESMDCEHCSAQLFDQARVYNMPKEEFTNVRFSEITCYNCNKKTMVDIKRICNNCKGTVPKKIYDVTLLASLTKVPRKGKPGQFKSEYGFSLNIDPRFAPVKLPEDTASEFWFKFKTEMQGPGLVEQGEVLQINVPEEWLKALNTQTQSTRPYGN